MRGTEIAIVIKAARFAADKHRQQRRKDVDASPYINHPIAVADLLANECGVTDPVALCAALLHDTIEDTDTTEQELRQAFGDEITGVGKIGVMGKIGVRPRLICLSPSPQPTEGVATPKPASHKGAGFS